MKLRQDIQAVLDVTRSLDNALRAGNLMACTTLLDQRENSLKVFSVTHAQANDGDRESCRSLLEELVRADENLQALGRDHLAEASEDLHHASPPQAEPPTLAACFDRKA